MRSLPVQDGWRPSVPSCLEMEGNGDGVSPDGPRGAVMVPKGSPPPLLLEGGGRGGSVFERRNPTQFISSAMPTAAPAGERRERVAGAGSSKTGRARAGLRSHPQAARVSKAKVFLSSGRCVFLRGKN